MRSLIALFLVLSACTADVDVIGSEPQGGPDLENHALTNNERIAFQYFVGKGLTSVQSAAIVGNLMQESSVTPTSVEYGGGPGRGIAQWSVGGRWDTSRGDNVTAFAAARGASRTNLQVQLDFIWYELSTYPDFGLQSLRSASTISSAVYAFQSKYEICGACASSKRVQYANQVLAAYGSSAGTPAPAPAPSTTCYSSTLGEEMPQNACVQSASDDQWYQCSGGVWVDRFSDPDPCNGEHPL